MAPYNPELDLQGNEELVDLKERARWEERFLKFLQVVTFQSLFLGHIVLWSTHCIPVGGGAGPTEGGWFSQTQGLHGIQPPPRNSFLPTEEFCTLTTENFVLNPQGDDLRVFFVTECKRCLGGVQKRLLLVITFGIKLPHYQVLPVLSLAQFTWTVSKSKLPLHQIPLCPELWDYRVYCLLPHFLPA